MSQQENQPQAEQQPQQPAGGIDFDSDTPIERPAEGQACSLEPGCESCQ